MRKTFLLLLTAISLSAAAQRERISMDDQWQFALGHASDYNKDYMAGTEYFNYLTKANSIHNEAPYVLKFKPGNEWKSVDLPHDWAVVFLSMAQPATATASSRWDGNTQRQVWDGTARRSICPRATEVVMCACSSTVSSAMHRCG